MNQSKNDDVNLLMSNICFEMRFMLKSDEI